MIELNVWVQNWDTGEDEMLSLPMNELMFGDYSDAFTDIIDYDSTVISTGNMTINELNKFLNSLNNIEPDLTLEYLEAILSLKGYEDIRTHREEIIDLIESENYSLWDISDSEDNFMRNDWRAGKFLSEKLKISVDSKNKYSYSPDSNYIDYAKMWEDEFKKLGFQLYTERENIYIVKFY